MGLGNLFWMFLLAACGNRHQADNETQYDLNQIKDSGCLVVLTMNSSTSYFHYRGEEMGDPEPTGAAVCP